MITRHRNFLFLTVLLSVLSFSVVAAAQNTTGSISGIVTDASGAVVSGANVHVRSISTGASRAVVSDGDGDYIVSQLPIGVYTVTATKAGFRTVSTNNVKVTILSTVTVNFALQVGASSQTVYVNVGNAQTALQTQSSEAGTVIESSQINDLPLNVRQFMQLIYLAPMAAPASNDYRSTSLPRNTNVPAAGGQMPENNNYQIDGMDNLETGRNNWNVAVPVDSVQEFRVQVGMPPAEFGRGGGAIVNVVTRSGTDQFHGSAYEFARNQTFDATPDFSIKKSPLKRNQFGASLGGPILRQKLFFFGNYEGLRQVSTISPPTGLVPTALEKQGIFPSTIKNPSTGQPFPNNTITNIDPISQKLLQLFPDPNVSGQPGYNFSYFNVPSVNNNYDYIVGRVDTTLSPKDTLFGRYLYDKEVNGTPPQLPAPANSGGSHLTLFNQGAGMQWNHFFTPTLMNTASVSYERYHQITTTLNSYRQDFISTSGITDTLSATQPLFWAAPNITIPGLKTPSDATPSFSTMNNYQLQDAVVVTRGKHTLKFGGDLQRIQTDMFFTGSNGAWTFEGNFTGNGFADFLLGLPESVTKTLTATSWNTWMNYGAMFAQDDWRATHNLTFNIGLRYEVETAINMSDRCGMDMSLVNGVATQIIPATCKSLAAIQSFSQNVNPSILLQTTNHVAPYNTDWNDIAPRFGFAYSIGANTVVHGGYGIFYADPQVASTASTNDYAPDDLAPIWTDSTSTPQFGWNPEGVLTGPQALKGAPLTVFPYLSRTMHYGMVQQWNANIERKINNNLSLQVMYQGSKDEHLLRYNNADWKAPGPGNVQALLPYPQYARIQNFEPTGFSKFDGASVRLEQAPWHGLNYLLSYTFSKSLDNASTMNEGPQWTDPYHQNQTAYGPSEFNIPNRLSIAYGYALPIGKGQAMFGTASGVTNAIMSGWGTRGIYQLQNGVPQSASMNLSRVGICSAACTARPNQVGNGNLPRSQRTSTHFYNTSAFSLIPAGGASGTIGNAGRDNLLGPPTNKWDAQLYKDTPIHDNQNVEFRWELYNALNHPQWAQPSTNAESPATFGVITGVAPQSWRIMQFAVRYQF
ncbi:MAG: carboxypeptidase regulatory-like domain-containing protein [Acidobacteriota bacterium]